jgi:PAS domain S-box-containing protein
VAMALGVACSGHDGRDRDLLAATSDCLWQSGADGAILSVSVGFEAALGIPPGALLGRGLADLAGAAPQRAKIAARRAFRDLIVAFDHPDSGTVFLEIGGVPIVEDGVFCGYSGLGRDVTSRVEAERELERYRLLVQAASDWFWETDAANRAVYVSPNIEATLGRPPSAYLGKRINETDGVTIDLEAGRANVASIKARLPYRDFIYSRRLDDGRLVWISVGGSPFYREDGGFGGYRGIARDVTAQVEAERALREREQQFRQILDAAADYYWEQDAKYRTVYLSPSFEKFHQVPIAGLIGTRLTDHPGISIDYERGMVQLQTLQSKLPFRDFTFSRQMADGTKRWFKISGAPIFDRAGAFMGYRGVGAEITKQVEAEALLRLGQQQLHEAVAHVTQPLAVYDAQDRVVAVNQPFFDLHREADGDYARIGRAMSFSEIIDWELAHGFYLAEPNEPPIDRALLLQRYESGAEHTYHLRGDRWMLVVHRALPGGGRVGLWTDITAVKQAEAERRTLEAQLYHAQRLEALGTMAGGAAHEINNALVPVIALSKLVVRKLPEGGKEWRNLNSVIAGAERSRDLVRQILMFSRKDGEQPHQEVDVGAVLDDALGLMRATVPSSIRIEAELETVPKIAGDPGQLHQVIVNMLTNAAQAIGGHAGSITVGLGLESEGGLLRVSVADTGCGMDEATLERIFEPFFTTKPVGEGSGLGLSVVHGIIKAHGGEIRVKSRPGAGTCFDILLPVPQAMAAAAPEAAAV